MDVTPELLREVEFREQRRGYNPDEVDDFLERLAVAFGQLQEQLTEALERANRAERRVLEAPSDEDSLRRTLVLAQRTVDATLEEARQQADATTSAADERAAATVLDAEERAAAIVAEAEGRVASELAPLLAQRDALEADVEALRSWSADVRGRMAEQLRSQLEWLERSGEQLPPPPDLLAIELPSTGDPSYAAPDVEGAPPVDDGAAAGGDATQALDLVGDEGDAGPAHEGPLAAAAAGDPFMAELRRAVTEDEPLGPRDDGRSGAGAVSASRHADDEEEPSSVFRRRKRR